MFYTAADKLIYKSPTGSQFDPLVLHRKLILASGGLVNQHLLAWSSPDTSDVEKAMAEEKLVTAARSTFGLAAFDKDGGVLDGVALDCLTHYLEWLEKNA